MDYSTKDKIMNATLELISEKGYKGATTREIAQRAGVNEVTLFRHFGSKKGIVEAIIQKYAFVDLLVSTFEEKVVWDVEKDLKMLVREYQALLDQKKKIILLSLKEAGQFVELDALMKKVPQKYTEILTNYFDTMMKKGKIKHTDPFVIATNFVFINFGYFLIKKRVHPVMEELSIDDFIENNIDTFIQSLQ